MDDAPAGNSSEAVFSALFKDLVIWRQLVSQTRAATKPPTPDAKNSPSSSKSIPSLESVVVLLTGWLNVNVVASGRNIRSKLVDALGADLIVAGTYLPSDCPNDLSGACMWERLHGLEPIQRRALKPMVTIEQLRGSVERIPNWSTILHEYQRITARYRRYRNISIWSPVLGTRQANTLREFHDYQRSLALLEEHERESRRGLRYERVVWSRLEYEWLAPHPPLSLLTPEFMWVPFPSMMGMSDHHAVLGRTAATFYLSRWNLLRSPLLTQFIRLNDAVYYGPEAFLEFVVTGAHVQYAYFVPLAYLTCCGSAIRNGGTCWQSRVCQSQKLGKRTLSSRYLADLLRAVYIYRLLQCNGAKYTPYVLPSPRPGVWKPRAILQVTLPAVDRHTGHLLSHPPGGKYNLKFSEDAVVLDFNSTARNKWLANSSIHATDGCPLIFLTNQTNHSASS